jgi:hypothetical protein
MTRMAIVVLLASLMGPALAAEAGNAAPPQPAPAAAPAANPSKVISDILTVSGQKKALENMPGEFISGVHSRLESLQSENGARLQPGMQQAIEDSAKAAFTSDKFLARVTRAMKKDYNEKTYQALLADLSSPVARKMAELESRADPSPQVFKQFVNDLESTPLPAARASLLRRLDAASRTSELMYTALLATNKGLVRGLSSASGKCMSESQLKKTEATMEGRTKAAKTSLEEMAIDMMAYTYRDVSDAELSDYVKIYETAQSRHVGDVIFNAIVAEYGDASMNMGRGIAQSVRQKRAELNMPACEDSGAPTNVAGSQGIVDPVMQADSSTSSPPEAASAPASGEQQGAPATPKSSIPIEKRKGGDITQCLESGNKTDKEIAACAEKFRKR